MAVTLGGEPPTVLTEQIFGNGQMAVSPGPGSRGTWGGDVAVVQTFPDSVHDRLFELFLAIDMVRAEGARTVTVVLPYFPYSRSDRPAFPGGPVPFRMLAGLIESLQVDRLVTFELHAPQLAAAFRCPVVNVPFAPVLARYLRNVSRTRTAVVSPDAGGAKRAEQLAEALDCPFVVMRKHRDDRLDRRQSIEIMGDVTNRTAILIDDEINSGQTAFSAAARLREAGAISVTLAAAHALFTASARNDMQHARVDRIIVTDSVGRGADLPEGVEILPIGEDMAAALRL